jgi:hypothetical protein
MNAPGLSSSTGPASAGPLTIGQILDRTFQLVRANLRLFVGIATVPTLATFAVYAAMVATMFRFVIPQLSNPPDPAAIVSIFFPAMIAVSIPMMAIIAVYLAAACHAATQANLGVRATFRESYDLACRRALSYFWLLVLTYLIVEGPILLLWGAASSAGLAMGLNKTSPGPFLFLLIPLLFLFYLAAMVYAILMMLRILLAFPASVAEGLPAWAAIKRSNRLTRGAKGRIFLVLLVIYAASYLLILVLFVALGLIASIGLVAGAAMHVHLPSPMACAGIGVAAVCALAGFFLYTTVTWAAFTTALAVLYHDQRLRIDAQSPVLPIAPGAPA